MVSYLLFLGDKTPFVVRHKPSRVTRHWAMSLDLDGIRGNNLFFTVCSKSGWALPMCFPEN